jgi:ABC-type transport system involved in multi-copper enzyme maturation permease subunit
MGMIAAFKEIFGFFFKQELKTKRVKVFFILSLLPVLIMLIPKINEMGGGDVDVTAAKVFSRIMLVIYIQLLMPILALLFGSSVVNEEVSNKTLVFLTTSPIPKPSIIFGKFVAFAAICSVIINAGLILCFLVVNIDRMGDMLFVDEFLKTMGVGILALLMYMALFTLLGTIMKKAGIVLGLLFIFGWESVVQYFPGVTQKFTVMHWVKSLLPTVSTGEQSMLQIFLQRLEPSTTGEALTVITVFVLVTLSLAAYVFKNKEYIMADNE